MRYNKRAQGLPLVKIVTAAIVLLVLVVVAIIGPGMVKKGFNNLLCAVDLCKEAEGTGDYILRTSVEFVDEDHVILHFTPNPTRCAEIRETNPYKISQAFVPYGEDYIAESSYVEVYAVDGKGDCGKEVLVPPHEGGEPLTLVQPDEYGTHMLRIDVYGEEQHNIPLEKVPVEVNVWERLLRTYLNADMKDIGDDSLSEPYYFPLMWSLVMHNKDAVGLQHCEQSMNLNQESIDEVQDILGMGGNSIEDIHEFTQGSFKDFLIKLGCAHPEKELGDRTLQIIMTALFGDIQDFARVSGQPETPGQPVPRIRNGTGIRGYHILSWTDQLLPLYIEVKYLGGDSSFMFSGSVRDRANSISSCVGLMGGRPSWAGEQGASLSIDSPTDSCFEGRQIEVELYYCPENKCQIGEIEAETPETQPEAAEEEESNRCATEINACNAQNCCPAIGSLPAVTPAGSYYTRGGACYHCLSSGQWEEGTADDSMCTICALPEGPLP